MSQQQQGRVRFIRRNGRVIPIRDKGPNHGGAAAGAVAAGWVGANVATVAAMPEIKRHGDIVTNRFYMDQTNIKSFIKKSGVERAVHIGGAEDARKYADAPKILKNERLWSNPYMAAMVPRKTAEGRGGFILAKGEKLNRTILAHELGHVRDYQKNPWRMKFEMRNIILGGQYRMEKRAWDLAPIDKVDPIIKKHALKTYEILRNSRRIGFLLGAGAVLGGVYGSHYLGKKDK